MHSNEIFGKYSAANNIVVIAWNDDDCALMSNEQNTAEEIHQTRQNKNKIRANHHKHIQTYAHTLTQITASGWHTNCDVNICENVRIHSQLQQQQILPTPTIA